MILPGESLVLVEMTPALFAAVAANEAEKAAPSLTLVDVQMIGATGRVFMSGDARSVTVARERMVQVLSRIGGKRRAS